MKIHELGHVVLFVSNLTKSADFYKNILGFEEIHRDHHTALFSSGRTHHELLLIEVGGSSQEKLPHPAPGLYHIGFKIGNTDDDLRNALRELENNEVRILGMSDHHVTHSLYILDPDGNELELYIDVDDVWKNDPTAILRPVKKLIL